MTKLTKIFLLFIFCLNIFFILASPVYAQETGLTKPKLQVSIPSLHFGEGFSNNKGAWIGEYIKAIYNYSMTIVGILAAVVLMFAGVIWLTAGGNASRVDDAKKWIAASLTGLVIALTSYMTLNIINPDLTIFQSLDIKTIEDNKNTSFTSINPGTILPKQERNYDPSINSFYSNGRLKNPSLLIEPQLDEAIKSLYQANAYLNDNDTKITSLNSTGHNLGSLHYSGRALDLSISNLTSKEINETIEWWRKNTGGRGWLETTADRPAGILPNNWIRNSSASGSHIHLDLNDPDKPRVALPTGYAN
ncbi:MAG: pilin [Patescibacteria group bacterium]